jgi:hypothetical protein
MSRLKSKTPPGDTLRTRPYTYRDVWIQKMDIDGDGGRRDLRMKDEPHQLQRLSIRWLSSSNDMQSDAFQTPHRNAELLRYLHLRRAGPMEAIPVGAARTALAVSGKSSVSFSTLLWSPSQEV